MDMLETLNHILEEHQQLRTDLKVVSQSLNDRGAMANLEKAQSEVLGNFTQSLSSKVNTVRETLLLLEEGLKHHYDFERTHLPPIIGEVLMEGLEIEHLGMLTEIESALAVLARTKTASANADQRVVEESLMSGLLDRIRREKEDHMVKEEAVLEIARIALGSRKPRDDKACIPEAKRTR